MKKIFIVFIAVIIFMAMFYFVFIRNSAGDYELIKKYVVDPVPKSMWNIKVAQTKDLGGYGYVFGFKINEDDLNLIIKSRSLEKAYYRDTEVNI